jgi:hypothetical protein
VLFKMNTTQNKIFKIAKKSLLGLVVISILTCLLILFFNYIQSKNGIVYSILTLSVIAILKITLHLFSKKYLFLKRLKLFLAIAILLFFALLGLSLAEIIDVGICI